MNPQAFEARRTAGLLALALMVLAMLYGWNLTNEIGPYGDDADYVILAEALLQGEYRPIHLAEAPPMTHRPPFYPLMLAPFLALFGRNYFVLKILTLGCALTSAVLGWRYYILQSRDRSASPNCAAVVMLPVMLSPLTIEFSTAVMTEVPYLALWLAFMVVLEPIRASPHPIPAWRLGLLVGLGVVLAMIRTIGLVVLGATALALIAEYFQRKYESLSINAAAIRCSLLLFMTTIVLGLLWRWMMSFGGVNYLEQLQNADLHGTVQTTLSWTDYLSRAVYNFHYYFGQLPAWLIGAPYGFDLWPIGAGFAVMALVGGYGLVRRGRLVEPVVLAGYAVVYAFWVTRSGRFLIPVLPLFILVLWEAVEQIAAAFHSQGIQRRFRYLIAVVVMAGSLAGAVQFQRLPRQLDTPSWLEYRLAADWIYRHTPRESVISCRKPDLMYLWSGRKTCWHPFLSNPDQALARLREIGATHLVRDRFPFTHTTQAFVDPMLETRREFFQVQLQAGETAVYRIQDFSPSTPSQ